MEEKMKILIYKEFYKKHFGKWTAKDILFGWFDYCEKYGIKDIHNADREIKKLNKLRKGVKKSEVNKSSDATR